MDRMNRELQKYDTISKKGIFYRIVSIDEDGVITAKRAHKDSYTKSGRPVVGTQEELEKRGYRFHDIAPVTCYQEEKEKDMDELKKRIDELEQENTGLRTAIAEYQEERKELFDRIRELAEQVPRDGTVVIEQQLLDKYRNMVNDKTNEVKLLEKAVLIMAKGLGAAE